MFCELHYFLDVYGHMTSDDNTKFAFDTNY